MFPGYFSISEAQIQHHGHRRVIGGIDLRVDQKFLAVRCHVVRKKSIAERG